MGWLDALRGFTMILVVSNHVALKSFGMQIRWSAALQFFLLFRMPLFFFISGFLAYKASRIWNAQTLRELSLKKMRVQLIPTIVFFLLFLAMIPTTPFEASLAEALASSMKAGYWFTLVLLYMLLHWDSSRRVTCRAISPGPWDTRDRRMSSSTTPVWWR